MEKLIASIDVSAWIGTSSLRAALSGVSTQIGRMMELVLEISALSRSLFFESIESVNGEGVAIAVRFSNVETGIRFVVRLVVDAHYPFVEKLPFEVDARFATTVVGESEVAAVLEEEVEVQGWKLLTRVCKRLDRLCAAE